MCSIDHEAHEDPSAASFGCGDAALGPSWLNALINSRTISGGRHNAATQAEFDTEELNR